MNNMMIDFETLGLEYNSTILQIAWIIFDKKFKVVKKESYILDIETQKDVNMSKDTLIFWLKTNQKVFLELLNGSTTIDKALKKFCKDVTKYKVNFIYANGLIDFFWLDYNLKKYQLFKNFNLNHKNRIDLNSLIHPLNKKDFKGVFIGTEHNALDDCENQLLLLKNYFNKRETFINK